MSTSTSDGGAGVLCASLDLPIEDRFLFFVGAASASESSGTMKSSKRHDCEHDKTSQRGTTPTFFNKIFDFPFASPTKLIFVVRLCGLSSFQCPASRSGYLRWIESVFVLVLVSRLGVVDDFLCL